MKDYKMKPFLPSFKVGDQVRVKGTLISGEITFIDWPTLRADIEYEEYDYVTSASFALLELEYLDS